MRKLQCRLAVLLSWSATLCGCTLQPPPSDDGATGDGPVAEGNVGGGTGMICYEFKGGTGTASRRIDIDGTAYTIGALVQANHADGVCR